MHRLYLFRLPVEAQPHIFCVKASRLHTSLRKAFAAVVADFGFTLQLGQRDIAALVWKCINAAPIAGADADQDARVQRMALQVGRHRLLTRHRLAHSSCAGDRVALNQRMRGGCLGHLLHCYVGFQRGVFC